MNVFNCSRFEVFYLALGRRYFYVRYLYTTLLLCVGNPELRPPSEMINQHQDSTTVASENPSHASQKAIYHDRVNSLQSQPLLS